MSNKIPHEQKMAERDAKLEKSHHRSEHFSAMFCTMWNG